MINAKLFKKVLFIGPNYTRKGGIASVIATYKKYITHFNFFTSIYFNNKILNLIFFPLVILKYFIYLFINNKIKIVHIQGSSKGSFFRKYFIFLISILFNKKIVYHIHSSYYLKFYDNSNKIIKKLINHFIYKSDAIILLSCEWKSLFEKKFPNKTFYVLNNIVKNKELIQRSNIDKIKLVFLGRIGFNKGIFDVLKAIRDNKEFYREKLLLSIGGDGDTSKLLNFIKTNGLNDIIKFHGWIDSREKDSILLNSNIMILPSYNEGLPISLLEGLSYSLPLISTHVGGIPQILHDYKNGIVVQPGDVSQIHNAIKFYIDNKHLVNIHGDFSHSISKKFSPENVFSNLKMIYNKII